MTRKTVELQRVYDERGAQIDRLELALQRATVGGLTVPESAIREAQANAVLGFAEAMVEVGIADSRIRLTAAGVAARIRIPSTVPAIPGTKEGA